LIKKLRGDIFSPNKVERKNLLAIAHRGYSARYPENSLASYKKAIEAKAEFIETDVRLSADGIAVAIHDSDLFRLTGNTAEIAHLSGDEIQSKVKFGGENILSTKQVLTLAKDHIDVLLDIKTSDMRIVKITYNMVVSTGMRDHVVFGLRDLAQSNFLRSIDPMARTLGMSTKFSDLKEFSQQQFDALRIWEDWYLNIDTSLFPDIIWITAGSPNGDKVGEITASRLARIAGKNVAAVILNDPTLITGVYVENGNQI